IAHLKPEFAHPAPVTEDNPEGEWITIAPLTSHAEIVTRREFERRVKLSKAIMEAAATGKPYPDAVQVEWSVGVLLNALTRTRGRTRTICRRISGRSWRICRRTRIGWGQRGTGRGCF